MKEGGDKNERKRIYREETPLSLRDWRMRRTNFSRTCTMGGLRESRKKTPIRIGFPLSTLRQKARGNVNIFKESI